MTRCSTCGGYNGECFMQEKYGRCPPFSTSHELEETEYVQPKESRHFRPKVLGLMFVGLAVGIYYFTREQK